MRRHLLPKAERGKFPRSTNRKETNVYKDNDDRVWINKSVHGQTKSKAGIRSVPLVSPFIVFPKSPKTLRKVLKPYGVDIHSLRHTYAYLLKQQGVHVTTAQRLLGHSDPRVTMGIYTQVLDNEIDDVGLLLAKAAGF
jgi:integrase